MEWVRYRQKGIDADVPAAILGTGIGEKRKLALDARVKNGHVHEFFEDLRSVEDL
jgi:hypothetical protein